MKQVDLSIERLLELRDGKLLVDMKPSETVQAYLDRWCLENCGERPLITMIQRVDNSLGYDKKTPGGLAFEFKEPRNAIMFKLTWA